MRILIYQLLLSTSKCLDVFPTTNTESVLSMWSFLCSMKLAANHDCY